MSTSALPGYGGVGSRGTSWRSSFHRELSRKRRVPCYGGRLDPKRFYRKTPVADKYLTDRTQRRTAAGAQLNTAGRTLGAARCFSQRRQALYSLRLLRTGSAPRSILIKRTPSKPGRCWSDVSFRWPARNELEGWWRLICWWLLTEVADDAIPPHTDTKFLCSVPDHGVLGPVPPATETLRAVSRAVTCCPENGRLTFEGWVVVVKEWKPTAISVC